MAALRDGGRLNGRGAGPLSSRERCCVVRVLAEKKQHDTKILAMLALPRPTTSQRAEQTVVTTTSGYRSVTTVHVGHIVHKATAVTRVGWAAQEWFSESSESGTVVLGNHQISVRLPRIMTNSLSSVIALTLWQLWRACIGLIACLAPNRLICYNNF